MNENEIIIAENEFLSAQLLEFCNQITEKDLVIAEMTEKSKYSALYSQENHLLRDQHSQLTQNYSHLQSEYMKLSQDMQESVHSREQMIEELKRLQKTEYSLQKDLDEAKTKLQEALYENGRLKKEEEDLNKELVKLSGHNNHNQKINYLSKIKQEYNVLKDINTKLKDETKKKSDKIDELSKKYEKLAKASGNKEFLEDENERQRIENIEFSLKFLTATLENLEKFISTLPFSREIPANGLDDLIIKIIRFQAEEIENSHSSLQEYERQLSRKESYQKLLENELLLTKQKNDFSRC